MRAPFVTAGAALLLVAGTAARSVPQAPPVPPAPQAPAAPGAPAAPAVPPAPREARVGAPKLIVFISVDQFRRDYVARYGSHWTGGLARLVKDGAFFEQSAYP